MIRRAQMHDIPKLFELGKRIHAQSLDRDIPLNEMTTKTKIAGLIGSASGFVLIDEVDDEITGVVMGMSDELFFSRHRYAIPFIAYAERRGAFVWMVKRFIKWAFECRQVKQVVLDTSFGGDLGLQTEKIYTRLGFERVGTTFIARTP